MGSRRHVLAPSTLQAINHLGRRLADEGVLNAQEGYALCFILEQVPDGADIITGGGNLDKETVQKLADAVADAANNRVPKDWVDILRTA